MHYDLQKENRHTGFDIWTAFRHFKMDSTGFIYVFLLKMGEKQFDHRCLNYPTHLNKTSSIVNWTAVNCFLIYRHLLSCLIYKWDKALWNAPLWNTAFKKLEVIWFALLQILKAVFRKLFRKIFENSFRGFRI